MLEEIRVFVMKINKILKTIFFKIFVLTNLVWLTSSCIPKATETQAVCGTNEKYNKVTRSCYSVAETRYTPNLTLSSDSINQETYKLLTLSYTDLNGDSATSCSLSGISSKIEAISPLIVEGSIVTQANNLKTQLTYMRNQMNYSTLAEQTARNNIDTYLTTMGTHITSIQNSFNHSNIKNIIGLIKTVVDNINLEVNPYLSVTAVNFYYTAAQTEFTTFQNYQTYIGKSCYCTGGVCKTYAIGKIGQSGSAGFSYTITDRDGESAAKNVSISISAMSNTATHLLPVAKAAAFTCTESSTSSPTTCSFTLPTGADYLGTGSFVFTKTSNPSLGSVTCSSSGSCTFTPTSGDSFGGAAPTYATVTISDIDYTANVIGTSGNALKIRYYDIRSTNTSVDSYATAYQRYGLHQDVTAESYIRVVGDTIRVFVNPTLTTTTQIINLINNDAKAAALVTASLRGGGSGSTLINPSADTASDVALAGATDSWDSFQYTVSNDYGTSTNTAKVILTMTATEDKPVYNAVAARSSTGLEDVASIAINLTPTYSDAESNVDACNADTSHPVFAASFTQLGCDCTTTPGQCWLTIAPLANVSSTSPYTIYYRVGSAGQYADYTTWTVNITPINDEPVFDAIADQTVNEDSGTTNVSITGINVGGGSFESTQTYTMTATSSNTALIPNPTISASGATGTLSFTPAADKSGTATITVTMQDNGGTTNGGDDTFSRTFLITVNAVNDPPYLISTLTKVETNEGGIVQSEGITIDEDQGSTTDEDANGLTVSSLTSDNTSVLPSNKISMFYDLNDNGLIDAGESRAVGATLESAAGLDSKLHKLYFKFDPVGGISGNSNITAVFSDGGLTTTLTFSFVVNPVSALHGGWKNISSIGLKTDKSGAPVNSSDIQCNYNQSSTTTVRCSGADCTGSASPHGNIVPDAAKVLYWDSAAKKCYRSQSASKFSWIEIKTSCPVTQSTSLCSGHCLLSSSDTVPTPTSVPQYYFNYDTNTCYISNATTANTDWETYVPSKVTLEWNAFTLNGSGADSDASISGYNVYRREASKDYNFKDGFLKTVSTDTKSVTGSSTLTFTDKTAVAGKVYYYLVRPIDSKHSLSTYTPEVFSEIRVVAPTANYSFIHRWMVNQEMCNKMHMTTTTSNAVDPTNNYRCPYEGPGSTGTHFDIGKDLLVDMNEMGCPYTAAPACSGNGCIGIGNPNSLTLSSFVANDVFYDRSSGVCYIYSGATWNTFESATNPQITASAAKYNSALNPPLTNVTNSKAITTCGLRSAPTMSWPVTALPAPELPSKKEYMAYSAHSTSLTDPQITEMEEGASLNVQSRCNGSGASGLENTYTDSNIPSSSYAFSVSGTFSSQIRSLYTGSVQSGISYGTETCSSRYGVQDVYGNVAEWVLEQISCVNGDNSICRSYNDASTTKDELYYNFGGGNYYAMDLITGPFSDVNASGVADAGDAYLTSWDYKDESYNAGKFSFPLGIPINVDIASIGAFSGANFLNYLLDIGPTSGITMNQLHEDGIIVNGSDINNDATDRAAMAVGGSYLSGNRAGRYSIEFVPLDASNTGPDIGFRCVIPVDKAKYPTDSAHTYSY